MKPLGRLLCVFAVLALTGADSALADGPAGSDPAANRPVPSLGDSCGNPTGAACVNLSIKDLDQARARLGQGPYLIPANFASLTAAEQEFVLTNLDRIQYGLRPITGLTRALSQDAATAIQADTDPQPTDPDFNYWTSNWAGGFENVELAYEAWMFDDGLGSGNLDCTSPHASGCWGHRHDILWGFSGAGPLAMGAATGTDPGGSPGYAMVLGEGDGNYRASYFYTWSQALAAGANDAKSVAASPAAPLASTTLSSPAAFTGGVAKVTAVRVSVNGAAVTVRVDAAWGSGLSCSLTRRGRRGFGRDHYQACGAQLVFSSLARGRYRIRVRSTGGTVTQTFTIR